jgi:SnoaL-like domain
MTKPIASRVIEKRMLLKRFAAAWRRRDVEGVLACMTLDCVYEASVGPEPGTTFRGIEEVRCGIRKMFKYDEGSESRISNLFIAGRHAAWEWTYVWRGNDGSERLVRGCDLFEFDGPKICRKSAFRKTEV